MDRLVPVEAFVHQAIERSPDRDFIAERDLIFDDHMDRGVRLDARHPRTNPPMVALCEPDTLRLVQRQPLLRFGRFKGIVVSHVAPSASDHSRQIGSPEDRTQASNGRAGSQGLLKSQPARCVKFLTLGLI